MLAGMKRGWPLESGRRAAGEIKPAVAGTAVPGVKRAP